MRIINKLKKDIVIEEKHCNLEIIIKSKNSFITEANLDDITIKEVSKC